MAHVSSGARRSGLAVPARLLLWGSAALLLLFPLVAMQLTGEVDWEPADFLTFGAMLVLLCLAIEVSFRLARSRKSAVVSASLAGLVFLLVWVELAVGIFD